LLANMMNNSRVINVRDTIDERLKVTTVNSLVYEINLFQKLS